MVAEGLTKFLPSWVLFPGHVRCKPSFYQFDMPGIRPQGCSQKAYTHSMLKSPAAGTWRHNSYTLSFFQSLNILSTKIGLAGKCCFGGGGRGGHKWKVSTLIVKALLQGNKKLCMKNILTENENIKMLFYFCIYFGHYCLCWMAQCRETGNGEAERGIQTGADNPLRQIGTPPFVDLTAKRLVIRKFGQYIKWGGNISQYFGVFSFLMSQRPNTELKDREAPLDQMDISHSRNHHL